MTKQPKARYTVANIITDDVGLVTKANELRKFGFTHADIYKRGLEEIGKEMLTQNNNA
jgi:hypothetical protein